MAPKEKAKAKAPPKEKEVLPAKGPAEGPPLPFPLKTARIDIVWAVVIVAIVIFLGLAIGIGTMYNNLKTAPIDPRLDPLMKLRSTMATTFKSPKLNYDNAIKVAAQVKTLPDQLAAEQQAYKKRKLKYQNLFKKSARSADGWVVFGRSLYYISKGKKTWYDAENFCMSRDAHLASILSDDEQSYVTSQLSHPAWIGLTDETQEGKWEWTDGSRLFTQYWSDGKPTRSERHGELEHDCTSIVPSSNGYNWKDAYCHELHRWVCKENLDIEGP